MPYTNQNVASVSIMQRAFMLPSLVESKQPSQPMAIFSDVQSYLNDADLVSLLSLDWKVPEQNQQNQLRENKYQESLSYPLPAEMDVLSGM